MKAVMKSPKQVALDLRQEYSNPVWIRGFAWGALFITILGYIMYLTF